MKIRNLKAKVLARLKILAAQFSYRVFTRSSKHRAGSSRPPRSRLKCRPSLRL